jgi:tetratricopeptide (TPR) repeat protein
MAERFISLEAAERDLLAAAGFLAERMPAGDDRAEALMAVVPRYIERGEVDLAAGLADTIEDPFVRDRLLIAVAAKCAESDDDEYAMQLAEAVEEPGLQLQALEALSIAKARKGDFESAKVLANRVAHPDNALAAIAVRQAENGDREDALETISEIDYAGASTMAMLAMAAMALDKEETEHAAELLETAGTLAEEIEHDEEKIRAMADVGMAFSDAGRKDLAIKTLDRAREYAEVLANVHRDNLLAAISQGFMRAGSVELADRTLDMVADKTQIATALVGFAREYWRRDEKDEALEALEEAYEVLRSQRESETRDTKAKFGLYVTIAAQFAGFEKGERAIELAEGIEDDDHSIAALGQIVRVLTAAGKSETARQALIAIPDDHQRVLALIGMSDAYSNSGDKTNASMLLGEAAEHCEDVSHSLPKARAYNEIIHRQIELGETEKAREIATANLDAIAEIKGEGNRSIVLASLAVLYANAGFSVNEAEAEKIRPMLDQSRF